jgi:hypothetical protein
VRFPSIPIFADGSDRRHTISDPSFPGALKLNRNYRVTSLIILAVLDCHGAQAASSIGVRSGQ